MTQKFVRLLSSLFLVVSSLLSVRAQDNTTLRTVSVECRELDFRSAAYRPRQMPRQIENPVDSLEAIERKTFRRVTLMATNPNPSMHTKEEEDRLTEAESASASSREAELRSLVARSKRNLGPPEAKYIKERIWEQQVLVWLDEAKRIKETSQPARAEESCCSMEANSESTIFGRSERGVANRFRVYTRDFRMDNTWSTYPVELFGILPTCTEESRPINANRTTCATTPAEEFWLIARELQLDMDRDDAILKKVRKQELEFSESIRKFGESTELHRKDLERRIRSHTEELNRRQREQLMESYVFIAACLFLGTVWAITVFGMGWNDVKPVV